MSLILKSETIETVVVIHCRGRIVLGDEIHALQLEVGKLRQLKKRVVLQLAEVDYIDSAGLGALVRVFSQLRVGGGGLKLCELSPFVEKVLRATNLLGVIPTYSSEKEAVEAFAERSGTAESAPRGSKTTLVCLDESNDLLAYLKAMLTRAGYEVYTAKQFADAKTMVVALGPRMVICGAGILTGEMVVEKFRESHPKLQVLVLPADFATSDASNASAELLGRVQSMLGDRA